MSFNREVDNNINKEGTDVTKWDRYNRPRELIPSGKMEKTPNVPVE